MNRKYNLRLDLQFRCNNSVMKFRQSDNKTSDFFIRITSGGELLNIDSAVVMLAVIKPDNTSQAQFLEIKEGKVYADLNSNMKDQVGTYKAQALLIYEDERVSTDIIEYEVAEDNILNQLEASVSTTEEFTMLQQMLSRLSIVENSENLRVENENSRVEAEKLREQAIEKIKNDATKLITDTKKEINDYKDAKDIAIDNDLKQYKTNTTEDITQFKNTKNNELDEYKNAKNLEIDNYVITKNKEIDNYKLAKDIEIDNYKKLKDTEINAKLEEVDTAETLRVDAEQQRATDHQAREQFLNSFESQLAQIETDITDLKNNSSGNTNINDSNISKVTTWSSDKIVAHGIEQDGVYWTIKEGNFISVDNTYNYKLKEIEVFGDTWQDESDLSNIHHVGELYLDEEGHPILDTEGREQYKVDIVSCNDINLMENCERKDGYRYNGEESNGSPIEQGYPNYTIVSVPIKKNVTYVINKYNTIKNIYIFDENENFVKRQTDAYGDHKFMVEFDGYAKFSVNPIDDIKYIYFGVDTSYFNSKKVAVPTIKSKQTILLPCQLMKVGDVKDRLYWDESKGRYVVEKNIPPTQVFKDNIEIISKSFSDTHYNFSFKKPTNIKDSSGVCICNRLKGDATIWDNYTKEGIRIYGNVLICLEKDKLQNNDNQTLLDYINTLDIYGQYDAPQLIETNITTPITIPAFSNKTHVYIDNSNNAEGTVKAKFPLLIGDTNKSFEEDVIAINNNIQIVNEVNANQDSLIDISLCATDEMYMMIEPILEAMPQTIKNERMVNKMVDMYVAMVIRGLKTIEEVPVRYRKEVQNILDKLEK